MVELSTGYGVYIFRGDEVTALNCTASDPKVHKDGSRTKGSTRAQVMARYVMNLFFKSRDLVNSTLSPNPKPGQLELPKAIVEAIVGRYLVFVMPVKWTYCGMVLCDNSCHKYLELFLFNSVQR
jgi:hypothetical protein